MSETPKLIERLGHYATYANVRVQWHGDGEHNLAVDLQAAAASLTERDGEIEELKKALEIATKRD